MDTMLQAAILGVVQGLTEFLPISSSGHLILVRWLFGWDQTGILANPESALALDLALHLGTAIAVALYFRKDLWRIFSSLFSSRPETEVERRLAIGIIIGSIPAALVGFLFEDQIDAIFRNQVMITAGLLIGFGILLWVADRFVRKDREVEQVGVGDALLVGIAQAIALAPGVSRSGVTMTAAMMLGLRREAAARFSFLLMSPIVLGASVVSLLDARDLPPEVLRELAPSMLVGAFSAAVVGAACIAFLLRYLRTKSMAPFMVYRIAIGAWIIWLAMQRASGG